VRGPLISIVTLSVALLASFPRAQGTLPPASPTLVPPSADPRAIVIDPGHGGDDVGARRMGSDEEGTVEEKTLTLAYAQRLRGAIETRLGLRVILTRDDDRAMTADERAALANSHKAMLFLSLHANAAPSPTVSGAEVLYAKFDEARDDAPSDALRPLEMIPWDRVQARHIDTSARVAAMLEETLRARVTMGPHPVQQAPLRGLVNLNMPAAIVEVGYLTNAEQAALVPTEAYQALVVDAIAEAVDRFRNTVDQSAP
jgi:N-acetylmuramoyl-L-alanine amidase